MILRIARRSTVAQRHIEHAVGPECQHAAVVIGKRLGLREQHLRRRGIGAVGIGRDPVLSDHRGAPQFRVVDEEASVRGVVRVKRQAQQPALVGAGVDDAGEVQERVRDELAVDDDANAAFLLDDEEATGAVAGVTGIHRTDEAADDDIGG